MLQDMVLQALDISDVENLVERLYYGQVERSRIVHLAPLVFRAARAGDSVARELVERQGIEVAVTATALLRRLGLLEMPADVVLGGSIFRGEGSLLIDTVRSRLGQTSPLARIVLLDVEPVVGALFCGMDMLQIRVDEAVRHRARGSYETFNDRIAREVALP